MNILTLDIDNDLRTIFSERNTNNRANQELRTEICLLIGLFVVIFIFGMYILRIHRENQDFKQQLEVNESIRNRPLLAFREFFYSNIKPTFEIFLSDYQSNSKVRNRFRLSRSSVVCKQEQQYVAEIFTALQEIKGDKIYENIYISGDTSYTIDKRNIYMCLKNWDQPNQEVVPLDVLVFVFLHECSHVACRDPQHSNEFWCIFRFILDIFCNYQHRSYKHLKICSLDMYKQPIQYCNGMQITYNPLFDTNTYIDFS